MVRVAERGAELAITTKTYRDRTGDLTSSTIAYIVEDSDGMVQVNLEMGMPYATYIIDKGLSDFTEISDGVAMQLDQVLDRFGEAGGGGFVVAAGTFTGPSESFFS
jgi:hypothetical protein